MNKSKENEKRNLAITTYQLNYEILKTYLIIFYKININDENVSFKKCIKELKDSEIITQEEFTEIENFTKKKRYFCRFIDRNDSK